MALFILLQAHPGRLKIRLILNGNRREDSICYMSNQARNQLGTPRGRRVFWGGRKFFELRPVALIKPCPTHFSRGANIFLGGAPPPWLRACVKCTTLLCVFFRNQYEVSQELRRNHNCTILTEVNCVSHCSDIVLVMSFLPHPLRATE